MKINTTLLLLNIIAIAIIIISVNYYKKRKNRQEEQKQKQLKELNMINETFLLVLYKIRYEIIENKDSFYYLCNLFVKLSDYRLFKHEHNKMLTAHLKNPPQEIRDSKYYHVDYTVYWAWIEDFEKEYKEIMKQKLRFIELLIEIYEKEQ